eukprot:XP_011680713.1 PREDICTED: lysosomal acid phosphatase-like [Strongylocentrotus purpuratus]
MAQQYELGQWLRERYVTDLKLFDGIYRPKQFYVRSSPTERTIMSAQSNLQGFFPAESGGGEPASGTPPWPPVPVFTVAEGQDYLLSGNKIQSCDAVSDFFQYAENSPAEQQYIKDNQTFHDTNIASFLGTFGLFTNVEPPTASCMMVELYKEDDGSHTVQLLFRNDTSKPPYLLKFPECNERCPVQNFFHIASPFVVDDIDELCRRKPPSLPLDVEWNIGWILFASSLALAGLLPLIVCVLLSCGVGGRRRLQNSRQRLEPINFHLLGGPNSESEDESVFDT